MYRIVSVTPTGWEPDNYGNVSFNLEIEAVNGTQRPVNTSQSPPASQNDNGKLKDYAKHAGHVFSLAWEESKNTMALIPTKDAEDLSTFEWLDLRLRIAQGFAIEINKIIRKEKF